MDRVVTISVNREAVTEAVMVKEPGPPPVGGRPVMGYGKHRRPGKNFQNTIANIQHTPSVIGGKCNQQIDWSQPAKLLGNTRKDERHAITLSLCR